MSMDQAVRVYRKIRDKRGELKREYEAADRELKDKLEQIERHMMWVLEQEGAKSMATEDGLVYLEEQTKASIADWSEFAPWVRRHDALDMLQRRIVIGTLKEYLKEHDELPPGVSIHRERVVRVRK